MLLMPSPETSMTLRVASPPPARYQRHGEIDRAADRGPIGERARRLGQRAAEGGSGFGTVDQRPADHLLLMVGARPLDQRHQNGVVLAAGDGGQHFGAGKGLGIAPALQLEALAADADRARPPAPAPHRRRAPPRHRSPPPRPSGQRRQRQTPPPHHPRLHSTRAEAANTGGGREIQTTRKFLNCQGSSRSRSSGNSLPRSCSGVQSL